ncbi:MAG TPA: zinc-ribbon domain-containing protein, partial [Ktedonobacteraceae bacterium]|nr:zinc-ribbon domain-containing protein [Ktedonobacteraceae bacterium]
MIIWGFRSLNKVLGQVQYVCQQCKQNSFHTVVRSRRWFTLFFIPIFPFTKSSISRCNICGIQTRMDNARADQ